MRSAVFFAALVGAVSAQLRIETPQGLTECQPAKIMWSGGSPYSSAPYYPAVIPGGQPAAAALKSFPQTSDTSLTWTVDIASGQPITMRITDSTGAVNYAEQVNIQAGSNKSCLSSSTSGNSTVASASGASGTARAASASSAGASGAAVVASSASGAASTARASASSISGSVSGVAASAASTTGSVASAARSGAAAASSSAAAGYLGAEPKAIGGVIGVVAGVVGMLVM